MRVPNRTIVVATRSPGGISRRTRRSFAGRLWRETAGQDLIESALMAGFVAVAAGALMPSIATSISTVFSNVGSLLTTAAAS